MLAENFKSPFSFEKPAGRKRVIAWILKAFKYTAIKALRTHAHPLFLFADFSKQKQKQKTKQDLETNKNTVLQK